MDRKSPISGASVEELIGRARSGDATALEELFHRCRPMLARWSKQRLAGAQPGGDRPSDIVQEAAMRAFSKFSMFHGTTEGEWNAWLKSILSSRASQSFRDAGREKRDSSDVVSLDSDRAMAEPAIQTSASQTIAFQEDWHMLLSEFHQLPENQQTALRLRHLEELSIAEVARRIQRGIAALREKMSDPAATSEDVVARIQSLRPARPPS
jgi:RNA polymerase sigma-70 factor, ECF subfamily